MEDIRFSRINISFLIAGLIVGFLVGYVSVRPSNDTPTAEKTFQDGQEVSINDDSQSGVLDINTPVSTTVVEDFNLKANNQPAGDSVIVEEAQLPYVSWITVREDRNGEFGSILGAYRLQPGIHSGFDVSLQRGTEANKFYHIVIYKDDGDGVFDYKADTLVSKDGAFYSADFMAL